MSGGGALSSAETDPQRGAVARSAAQDHSLSDSSLLDKDFSHEAAK